MQWHQNSRSCLIFPSKSQELPMKFTKHCFEIKIYLDVMAQSELKNEKEISAIKNICMSKCMIILKPKEDQLGMFCCKK